MSVILLGVYQRHLLLVLPTTFTTRNKFCADFVQERNGDKTPPYQWCYEINPSPDPNDRHDTLIRRFRKNESWKRKNKDALFLYELHYSLITIWCWEATSTSWSLYVALWLWTLVLELPLNRWSVWALLNSGRGTKDSFQQHKNEIRRLDYVQYAVQVYGTMHTIPVPYL